MGWGWGVRAVGVQGQARSGLGEWGQGLTVWGVLGQI